MVHGPSTWPPHSALDPGHIARILPFDCFCHHYLSTSPKCAYRSGGKYVYSRMLNTMVLSWKRHAMDSLFSIHDLWFFCERNHSIYPYPQWWNLLGTVRYLMNKYEECIIAIQGRERIITEQAVRLEKNTVEIKYSVGSMVLLSEIELLIISSEGSCIVIEFTGTETLEICELALVTSL